MHRITYRYWLGFAALGLILFVLNGCASCGPDNQKRDCISGAGSWGGVFGGF